MLLASFRGRTSKMVWNKLFIEKSYIVTIKDEAEVDLLLRR